MTSSRATRRQNPPLIEHIKHDDIGTIIHLLVVEHGIEKVLECVKVEAGEIEEAAHMYGVLDSPVAGSRGGDPLEELHEITEPEDTVVIPDDDDDSSSDEGEPVDELADIKSIEEENVEANLVAEKEAIDGGDKFGVFDNEDNLLSSWSTKAEANEDYKERGGKRSNLYIDELVDGTV